MTPVDPAILEAAARALQDIVAKDNGPTTYEYMATAVLTAVTPLIRAQVREEAAKAVENYVADAEDAADIAAAIRALVKVEP